MHCEITINLKELRLHGMVNAWMDLTAQGESAIASSKWLIEHLLKAEQTDRATRSVSHQLKSARFPIHRDLAKFDFAVSSVDEDLVKTLATMTFTDTAQNVVFIGGPGTGKTHLATAIAVSGITSKGMRVRFYSTTYLTSTAVGAGESPGQGRSHRHVFDARGYGDFGRVGVLAV